LGIVSLDDNRRNPLQNRVTIQINNNWWRQWWYLSQSPSKPGHYSNAFKMLKRPKKKSQSPSKPGHYSNLVAERAYRQFGRNPLQNRVTIQIDIGLDERFGLPGRNPLQNRVTIQIFGPQSKRFSGKCRNPLQNRVTIQIRLQRKERSPSSVAIPFKTGSLFKFMLPAKFGTLDRRNPLQNRVTIQIGHAKIDTICDPMSQSPSKPGHYSNKSYKGWWYNCNAVAIPFKTGSLFK